MRESWSNNPIRVVKIALVGIDIGALLAVAALETWRAGAGPETLSDRWLWLLPCVAFVLLYPSLLFAFGLYDHAGRPSPRTRHPLTLVLAVALWTWLVELALLGPDVAAGLWPPALLIGAAVGGLLWVLRLLAMHPSRYARKPVGILLLGWDRSMELLVQVLQTHPYRRQAIIGLLASCDGGPDLYRPDPNLKIPELRDKEARTALSQGHAGVLALPSADRLSASARELVHDRPRGVQVRNALTICEGLVHKVPVTVVGNQALEPALHLREPRHGPAWETAHRSMDILIAGALLILFLPLMVLVAAGSLIFQGRPVIFAQTRIGAGSRPFTIYKFRSMKILTRSRQECELMTTIGDSRLTQWGRFLRRLHLDELPQLWNILHGEMSLVGPRPISKELDVYISTRIPYWELRYQVRPGATGWEQVSSGDSRNPAGHCRRLEFDLYYIEHASIMLDIYILLKTPGVLMRRRGAR